MYNNTTIMVLRLLAIYLAIGLIPNVVVLQSLFYSDLRPELIFQIIFGFCLELFFCFLLWYKAGFLNKLVLRDLEDKSESSEISSQQICLTIIIAAGFLILAKSTHVGSVVFQNLLNLTSGQRSFSRFTELWEFFSMAGLGMFLILNPKKVLKISTISIKSE